MIGLFAVSEVIVVAVEGTSAYKANIKEVKLHGFGLSMKEFIEHIPNFIRSSLTGIGIGGALIPMLTLGISSDTVTAIILGGLTLEFSRKF